MWNISHILIRTLFSKIIFMKILSNFDTQFREKFLARQKKRFSDEQILVLYRSRYHLYFRVILPGVFLYFLGMMILFIVFQIGKNHGILQFRLYLLGFCFFGFGWFINFLSICMISPLLLLWVYLRISKRGYCIVSWRKSQLIGYEVFK